MHLSQLSLNKRLAALFLPSLAFVFLFVGCGSVAGTGGSPTPVPYKQGSGQVLIRLINAPGNIFPSIRPTPTWELYGDGTLLYQSQDASSGTLLQSQLQPADVAHIMDVVVNQDSFFADQKTSYGKPIPDVGETDLTVNTTKQQKTVTLFKEAGAPPSDQHMFSILHFLQSYRPASSHPYTAPGAVVLVRQNSGGAMTATQWPYPDISLSQVANQECETLNNGQGGACPVTSGSGGYFPIYGKRGTDLLNMLKGSQAMLASQGNQTYTVLAWPLLPENMVQTDGKQWVQTEGMNGGRWPLLPGTH
ncbi:MAG TPA: hypothetical protein VH593_13600 [Ktedonobacteraceae bacterium]